VAALDELSIIARYFRPLAGEGAFDFLDDAGRISVPADQELVVTTDMVASGVHFLPDDPADSVARKALRVNLSDLAAKGARPVAYTLSLALDEATDEEWIAAFARGLGADQREYSIGLLGGDTIAVPQGPVISITAFGVVSRGRMVHRFGGKPGDALYVSGEIGAGAAGLALLRKESGPWDALAADARERLIGRYRIPEPRMALAVALTENASAAMDISDGLVGDCDKLAAASGCLAEIAVERIPLPKELEGLRDQKILARLLTAGDDYEILAAVPPTREGAFAAAAAETGVAVARIGALAAGSGKTKVSLDGRDFPLYQRAFVHGGQGRSR
jgi:thiamine-monophosphate kinase